MDILVVEDHAPMRAALCDVLRIAYPHASLREAGSAAQALQRCRERTPRLVLLDIGLPDGNGIELIPEIRSLAEGSAIVVVTQHAAPEYFERALLLGARAFVSKAALRHELLPALAAALEGMR